jgi:hypothetical protein
MKRKTRAELREDFNNAPLDEVFPCTTINAVLHKSGCYYATAGMLRAKGVPLVKHGERWFCVKKDLLEWMEMVS